jgi:two-component system cell cycle sensor histidine kinase/response regulator CckA
MRPWPVQETGRHIKLVILDMIMPGPGVDDTIRRLEKSIRPSVFCCPADTVKMEIARNLMQHCNGFIQKPFRLTSLSTKIRELLGTAADENP